MKSTAKKTGVVLGVIAVFVLLIYLMNRMTGVESYADKYAGVDLLAEVDGLDREGTYSQYIASYSDAGHPATDVDINVCSYASGKNISVYQKYEGEAEALYTGDGSTVTWNVEVPEAGFYNVYLEYMTIESRGVAVERAIYINGESPFTSAANLTFKRQWTDKGKVITDNQGNQIRPSQIEVYKWQSAYCKDDMGYMQEPYQFYFKKGNNALTLAAVMSLWCFVNWLLRQ